jgi:hypothetical protein
VPGGRGGYNSARPGYSDARGAAKGDGERTARGSVSNC